jgi:hypothetical protein
LLDGLAVVRSEGREPRHGPYDSYDVERVTILDAAFPKRGEGRLLVERPGRHGSRLALSPGRTYLILGVLPRDGQHQSAHRVRPGELVFSPFADASAGDFTGLAHFATRQTRLSPGEDRLQIVQNSIADAFRGATDEDARRLRDFLHYLRGLAFPQDETQQPTIRGARPLGRNDSPMVRRIREAVASERPYVRVQAMVALNGWNVWHSADDLLDAIADCAGDPALFGQGDPVPRIGFVESAAVGCSPPGYRPRQRDPEAWIARLETARNVRVKRYLLRRQFPPPDDGLKRRFARMLNDPDRESSAFVAIQLAVWENDRVRWPQVEDTAGPDGERVYSFPNLEEVLPYWRRRYGVPSL